MGNNLPSIYQEVEYLQSSGTQYINTGLSGYKPSEVKYDIDIELGDNNTKGLIGARNSVSSGVLNIFAMTSTSVRMDIATQNSGSVVSIGSGKHRIQATLNEYQIDDNTPVVFTTTNDEICNNSIYLFTFNNNGTVYNGFNGKYYDANIYINSTLTRNFIPCYKKENNEAGMYDTVNDVFYTNAGSGTFTVGPVVIETVIVDKETYVAEVSIPNTFQEVEYLQSSGTQYIDTDFIPDLDEEITLDFQYETDNATNNHAILGTYGSSYQLYGNNNSEFYFIQGSGYTCYTYPGTTRTVMVHNIADKTLTLNGVSQTATPTFSALTTPKNWYLFTANNINDSRLPSIAKIYDFKITRDGSTIKHMIPCKRVSDSKPGMYDITTTIRLPAAYQEVEYLESSGTQYITNVLTFSSSNSKIQFDCSYQFTDVSNIMVIANSMGNQINLLGSSSGHPLYAQAGSTFVRSTSGRDLNKHTVVSILDKANQRQTLTVDGSTTTQGTVTFQSSMPISIFAAYDHSTEEMEYPMYGKIFYAKIYLDGTLVRNLVPCYRKSDSVAGMYDLVTGNFYTNSGTGTFSIGNEIGFYINQASGTDFSMGEETTIYDYYDTYKEYYIVETPRLPSEYQEVEYLESSGTQYIDIEADAEDILKMEIDCQTTATGTQWITGRYLSGTTVFDIAQTSNGNYIIADTYNTEIGYRMNSYIVGTERHTWLLKRSLTIGGTTYFYKDGTQITTSTQYNGLPSGDMLLFGAYYKASTSSTTTATGGSVKIYSAKYYGTDEELIRNFVPCKRKSDSVAGMYDLVECTFYENDGTGTFSTGDNVEYNDAVETFYEIFVM